MLRQIVLFCPATIESSFQNYKVILVIVDQTTFGVFKTYDIFRF